MKTINTSNRTNILEPDPLTDRVNVSSPVTALATNYPDGHVIPLHQHSHCQLVHAVSGVMTVTTAKGIWVIPPHRAVWVPAHIPHEISASGELLMRSLLIKPEHVPSKFTAECFVVSVSPLLKELILYAVTLPQAYNINSHEDRIIQVIIDLIACLEVEPTKVSIPSDRRLLSIYKMLLADPADNRSLVEWGMEVGATNRNLARLFRAELGLSFGQWRQQLRVIEAMKCLAMNEPVTTVSLKMGYTSTSAFIAVFKKYVGYTPGDYFRQG